MSSAEQARRRGTAAAGVMVNLETVWFPRASSTALRCYSSLTDTMYKDSWSWTGRCQGCQRNFAPGLPDGSCEHSRPQPLAGVSLRNDKEIVKMMADLGGASMLVYNEGTDWSSGFGSAVALARKKRKNALCPRCRAVDTWVSEWQPDLMKRLKHVAQQIVNGQTDPDRCLDELPQEGRRQEGAAEDLLFSHRLRSIVRQLRVCIGPGGVGGPVAIMVPSGLICYVLWHLLCVLQPVWQGRQETGVTLKNMLLKMLQRPVRGRHACARYHAGLMVQAELHQIARDVKELRVPVVVVYTDTNAEILPGEFGSCSQVLCWSRHCGPTDGLLLRGSRLTYMYENSDDHVNSNSWDGTAIQAETPPSPQAAKSSFAVSETPLQLRPEASAAAGNAALLDDDEYARIATLVERLWLRFAPDSYTVAAFREQDVWEQAGVFLVKYDASKGYQAMVRSPGQLASLDLRLRSTWTQRPEDAKRQAAKKAMEVFEERGLFNTSQKEIGLSTASAVAGVDSIEQLTPLESKLLDKDPPQKVPSVSCLEGPWIKLIDRFPAIGGGQASPYCMLCETWADDEHLCSRAHKRAKRDLEGGVLLEARPPVFRSGEAEIHEFAALHAIDLSLPTLKWPRLLRLLRFEPTITADDVLPPSEYGILLAPPTEEVYSVYFGLSLEWCRGAAGHGAVRIQPQKVDWEHQCRKIGTGWGAVAKDENPEQLLRNYHEAMLHKFLPAIRPHAAEVAESRPTSALLVKLAPDSMSGDSVRFAWSDMKAVVDEQNRKVLAELIEHSTAEDADDEAKGTAAGHGQQDAVLDVFVAPHVVSEPKEEITADAPPWLMSVLHRWFRLHDFELAALKYGAVFPVLSPLAMEAALTLPSTGVVNTTFDALRALGSKVLGVVVALTAHCRHPDNYHAQLAQHIAELLPKEKLARYLSAALPSSMLNAATAKIHIEHWAPPGARCRPLPASNPIKQLEDEDLAHIAEAFIGAYYLSEGNFFSAHQFILWLQDRGGEQDKSEAWEQAVLGHLLCGAEQSFRGRTPSYLEFHEIFDSESKEKILHVRYSEMGQPQYIAYRRSKPDRKYPEERREGGLEEYSWKPLVYNNKHQTFVSIEGCKCPLPNKVTSWLLGKPTAPLVTVKPYTIKKKSGDAYHTPTTPEYVQLQEKKNGTLWVRYKEYGWFIYTRSENGDLGKEQKGTAENPGKDEESSLIYSETMKTLKSYLLQRPLPNKVVEWIHHQKCLSFIVTPKKNGDHPAKTIDVNSEVDDHSDDTSVMWTYENHKFKCWVQDTPFGIALMEEDVTNNDPSKQWQELLYSEELKTWLSPTMSDLKEKERDTEWKSGVPVPSGVLDWLKKCTQMHLRGSLHMSSSFRRQYFKTPWCEVPHFVRAMLPRTVDLMYIEENVLDYNFSNSMLLIEALTHASCTTANTPSNQRLALLGGKLMETLLTEAIIQRTGFPIHSTWIPDEKGDTRQLNQTFAVSALHGDCLKWPQLPVAPTNVESALKDSRQLLEWVNACCNSVTYAYVCCQKKVHKHILYTSTRLCKAMGDFAKIAKRASANPASLWLTLSTYDAPRVLSDALLAIVAAVFLDSNWTTCKKVFTNKIFDKDILDHCIFDAKMIMPDGGPFSSGDPVAHLKRLGVKTGLPLAVRRLPPPACGASFASPNVKDALTASLQQTMLDPSRGQAFCPMALAPAPPTEEEDKAVCGEKRWRRDWNHQCEMAFGLRDFNYCTLWVGGHSVGPPVAASSPRSAARRCASLALGGGGDGQALEALMATKSVLACAQTMEGVSEDLKRMLFDMNVLQRASQTSGGSAGAREEEGDATRAEQLVVRCPAGTVPILLGNRTEAELSDSSSEKEESTNERSMNMGIIIETVTGEFYCKACDMSLNGPTQAQDHGHSKKHKKNEKKMYSPDAASVAAGKRPEDSKTIKTSKQQKRSKSSSKESDLLPSEIEGSDEARTTAAAGVGDNDQRTTASVATDGKGNGTTENSLGCTNPRAGTENWASTFQQRNGGHMDGQRYQAYVLWPPGLPRSPTWDTGAGTYLSDGQYNWYATPWPDQNQHQ